MNDERPRIVQRVLLYGQRAIRLSECQWWIAQLLIDSYGNYVSYQLLEQQWIGSTMKSPRAAVHQTLGALRRKIDGSGLWIEYRQGFGYKLCRDILGVREAA